MNETILDCLDITSHEGGDSERKGIFEYVRKKGQREDVIDPCAMGMMQAFASDADIVYLTGGLCIQNDKSVHETSENGVPVKLIALDKMLQEMKLTWNDVLVRAKDMKNVDAVEKLSDRISKESNMRLIIGDFQLPNLETNDIPLPLFEKIKQKSGKKILYIKIDEPSDKKSKNELQEEIDKMLMTDADVGILSTNATVFSGEQAYGVFSMTGGKILTIWINSVIKHFHRLMEEKNFKLPTDEKDLVPTIGESVKVMVEEISKISGTNKGDTQELFGKIAKVAAGSFSLKDSGLGGLQISLLKVIRSPRKKNRGKKEGGADLCKITIDEIIQKKPALSFILGRSCVGKSTLAKQLADSGFNIINLDKLIEEIGLGKSIKDIYHDSADEQTMKKFIQTIVEKIKDPTIIEGAIKKMSLIDKIIKSSGKDPATSDSFTVYIEPENAATVERNMTERFKAMLEGKSENPLPIKVTTELLEDYKTHGMEGKLVKEEMRRFAEETLDISKNRKELFSETSGGRTIYVLPSESIKIGGYSSDKSSSLSGCGCQTEFDASAAIETETPAVVSLSEFVEEVKIEPTTPAINMSELTEEIPSAENISEFVEETGSKKKRKKVRFEDSEKKKQSKTHRVTIGGVEYDATGYGVYEVQQRRFRTQNDPEFNPLELYGGQTYTDCNDIAMKMIKKSKINELCDRAIGGLSEALQSYERVGGVADYESYMILSVTSPEVKRCDIEDLGYLKQALTNFIGGHAEEIISSGRGIVKLKSAGSKLKLSDTDKCKKRLLELERKSQSIIRKLEKRITDDINFIEKVTELLKSRANHYESIGGGEEPTQTE